MAQGDDEVTVAAGDDVSILDDSTSEEWWQVRRLKNGNQGVVPSSYIEITGSITPIVATYSDVDSAKATVEQNRLEEIRLTKEAIRASKQPQQVGMGMNLPERGSSLVAKEHSNNLGQQRSRHETGRTDGDEHPKAKSKPELTKVRAWTDRSGSFTVEAQFLGLKDGKIHLHKMNGVKIAVPITKMSRADLGYVESATGISLDDDRPLADVKTAKSAEKNRLSEVGATVGKSENIDYDWFEFFLACEVAVGLCERYAQAFARDSMDESVLPDVNATILRTLGLREGDIIKVMRKLDAKYGRDRGKLESNEETTGAFSLDLEEPFVTIHGRVDRHEPCRQATFDGKWKATQLGGKNAVDSGASRDRRVDRFYEGTVSTLPPTSTNPNRAPTNDSENDQHTRASRSHSTTHWRKPVLLFHRPQTCPIAIVTKSSCPTPTGTPSMSSTESSLIPPPPQRPLSAPQAAQLSVPSSSMMPQMTGPIQSQAASPGSNLNNLAQVRLVQQYSEQLQPASTVYLSFQDQGLASYSSGATNQQQYMQPMMTGVPGSSPFPDSGRPLQPQILAQPSGLPSPFPPSVMPYSSGSGALGGVNSILPSPLEPQRPGGVSLQLQQMDALGSLGGGFTQPIQPQQTGPPPPVRFGVVKAEAQRLTPQQTGRRANLAQATPQNPFGF
ncbi:hypothetical protein DCS_08300 [Drechmeria coniospora]|uniref:Actin cytoskeleton-regulatory complex protein SLA1 n=1 Tax=Drechmeria coniospora TaxID=98403 RepID=A0A151GA20_DRECN|nr:uncharacterized protein DCS_08300 [Drechmeria coniospora]KYK53927.1 hypothetical protein DCS_08300 [Drechmeria coniospora]